MSTGSPEMHVLFVEGQRWPDIYWSSKAADEAARQYGERKIVFQRYDFPDFVANAPRPMDDRGYEILTAMNDAKHGILVQCQELLSAEARWRKWLADRRPSETR